MKVSRLSDGSSLACLDCMAGVCVHGASVHIEARQWLINVVEKDWKETHMRRSTNRSMHVHNNKTKHAHPDNHPNPRQSFKNGNQHNTHGNRQTQNENHK